MLEIPIFVSGFIAIVVFWAIGLLYAFRRAYGSSENSGDSAKGGFWNWFGDDGSGDSLN